MHVKDMHALTQSYEGINLCTRAMQAVGDSEEDCNKARSGPNVICLRLANRKENGNRVNLNALASQTPPMKVFKRASPCGGAA